MTKLVLHARPRHHRLGSVMSMLVMGGAWLLAVAGCTAWRLVQAKELVRRSEAFSQRPATPLLRMLIVGDSTAVGTGASAARFSLAGLIAREHPGLLVDNRGRDGALLVDVAAQLAIEERFDIVLVLAGGNDVIRMRDRNAMRADVESVADAASARAPLVVLMPSGNVGNAPFFFRPFSWLMTSRSRSLHDVIAASAARRGLVFVDLFRERGNDPFVAHPSLNASDGLHPSDAGYSNWWHELRRQAGLVLYLTPSKAI